MGQQAMIPHANSQAAGHPPHDYGKQECLPGEEKYRGQRGDVKRHHKRCDAPVDRLRKGFVTLPEI